MADSRSGTEKCKMSLEYLGIPESKEAIKVHRRQVKRTQSQLQEASTSQKWGIKKSNI